MATNWFILFQALVYLTISVAETQELNGAVCTRQVASIQAKTCSRTTRSRRLWRRRARTSYYSCPDTVYRTGHFCCTGYGDDGTGNCAPICNGSFSCPNGGTCTKPNYCTCPVGYYSPACVACPVADIINCTRMSCSDGLSNKRCLQCQDYSPVGPAYEVTPNGQQCIVSIHEQPQHGLTGGSMDITCLAASGATTFYPNWDKCAWSGTSCPTNVLRTFPNQTLERGYERRVEHNSQSLTMTLKNLTLEDGARYRCSGIGVHLAYTHVYIAGMPHIHGEVSNKLTVSSTQDETVRCEVSYVIQNGSNAIRWLMGNVLLPEGVTRLSSMTSKNITTNTNLLIKRFVKEDNGKMIKCLLLRDKKAIWTETSAILDVQFSPEAVNSESCIRKVTAAVNDNAQLCLHVDANPQPVKYEWRKGRSPNLQDINPKNMAINDQYSSSLTFVNVTSADFGAYTVIVSNGIGEDKQLVFELIPPDNLFGLIFGSVVPVACLIVIGIVIIIWCVRRTRVQPCNGNYEHHNQIFSVPVQEYRICKPNITNRPKNCKNLKPRLEIDRSSVTVLHKVREGRFGYWFKGKAVVNSGHDRITATVIMTKKDDGDSTDLLNQFRIWKILIRHPNLVSLLGCCIEEEPIYIVCEYVSSGNLYSYLKSSGSHYEYGNMLPGSNVLTPRDLMIFAVHVATGMEYLSSMQIVHGDLATRNVLLDKNHTCKICDFGLNTFCSQKATRWMSPETLLDNTFTTSSDVWSYGVLLWEITTLAATPYSGMSCQQVKDFVQDGGKLSKPKQCDTRLYDIMMCCWVTAPEERYDFSKLRNALLEMLDKDIDYIVL